MRIVCLNAWGGRRQPDLGPWLATCGADVLVLQEVVHAPGAPADWLSYRDDVAELPQRADMLADLATLLPDHVPTFCPAARGRLWHGNEPVMSYWGLATLTRRGLPVIAQAQGFVHGAFGAEGFGAHPRSRTGHAARLFRPDTGTCFTVAHMHGLRDPAAGKADTPARAGQARRFAALASSVAAPGEPLVLCGDFNVRPDSETLRLLSALAPRELVTEGGFAGTRTSFYTKPERHADYMMVNAAVPVRRFEVSHAPEVSDHCPLILDMA